MGDISPVGYWRRMKATRSRQPLPGESQANVRRPPLEGLPPWLWASPTSLLGIFPSANCGVHTRFEAIPWSCRMTQEVQ